MRPKWILAILLALTFLTFAGSLRYQFVWDDLQQIVDNSHVQSWRFVPAYFTQHVWAQDPEAVPRYYRPLFLLLLRLTHAAIGLWTPGWHLLLIVSHLAAVVSVYWLVRQWKDFTTALLAAALFAVHPIHSEVVSWASAVSESVLLVALIACLIFALREGAGSLAASVGCFAVALLLKETAIVWIGVIFLALYDGWDRTIRRTLPFWGVCAAYLLARTLALGNVLRAANEHTVINWSLVPTALAHYFLQLVWPVRLSEFYFLHGSWAYLFLVVPVLGCLVWLASRDQYRRVAVLILLAPLVPVLNLYGIQSEFLVQDRYLYVPSAGFVMLAALLIVRLPRPAIFVLLAVMAVGCIRESRTWSDSEHLYGRALELSPNDQRARDGLARAYARQGRYEEAVRILEPLVQEAQPSSRRLQQSLMTLAWSHEHLGRKDKALAYYSAAQDLFPRADIQKHIVELQAAGSGR